MNTKKITVIIFCMIYWINYCLTQQSISFEKFQGTVYFIPKDDVKRGYRPQVLDYQIIAEIELDSLKIPKTNDSDSLFPGLNREAQFGIIFSNQMIVEEGGCYEISLNSDDGSILWIDDQEILYNDGAHKMTKVSDTIYLRAHEYKIKIWYYNAYPTQYGLIFDVSNLLKDIKCKTLDTVNQDSKRVITLDDVLFNLNSFQLSRSGQRKIESISDSLKVEDIHKIKIIGHTDDLGSKDFNMKLSLNRALTVLEYLRENLEGNEIEFQAVGYGSNFPKVPNTNEQNRKINRRVEIIIE